VRGLRNLEGLEGRVDAAIATVEAGTERNHAWERRAPAALPRRQPHNDEAIEVSAAGGCGNRWRDVSRDVCEDERDENVFAKPVLAGNNPAECSAIGGGSSTEVGPRFPIVNYGKSSSAHLRAA
jgi:hypothetical protein